MQPTLIISASVSGILYLNGCFAGEIDPDAPLVRPVGGRGALYLDFRPFTNDNLSMTRRLVFSGGAPLAESVENAENLNLILWPNAVTELELTPDRRTFFPMHFQLAGHSFTLNPEKPELSCDGRRLTSLPEGALQPEYRPLSTGAAFIGDCTNGKYLFTTDAALQARTGFLLARQLDIESDERIRAVTALDDLVGHATLETWRLTPNGLMLLSSEPAWANGAPRWPVTPAETARAAVEAALAGLDAEAEGYLAPALRSQFPIAQLRENCDLCIEMKYAPPDPRPCVGLLKLEGARMARVSPLYFQATPTGGPQGPWQLERIERI